MAEIQSIVAETESQSVKVGQLLEGSKRRIGWDKKLSRLKYSGVRLIQSDDYSEADEARTRANAYERIEDLARKYFPDATPKQLEPLLNEVRQYLDTVLTQRFRPHKPLTRR